MSIMIGAEELHQQLSSGSRDTETIIFDCRFSLADFELGRNQFMEGHIPGAQHMDMEQHMAGMKAPHGGRHPLPSAEQFTKVMQQMGVNSSTKVIAYDDNRLAGAARLWWLLQYFGHRQIQILDGGFKAWKAQGFATSQQNENFTHGNFQAIPSARKTQDYLWLKEHLDDTNLQLIDSREAPRYKGLEEPIDPVAGHIPGALNFPWPGVTNDQGFVLADNIQQQRWRDLDSAKETLVYCGSGVTACVNLLSLKLAGFENAKLYPGSWSDWCSYTDSPKKP